jgi:hypothetical protein
MSAPKRKKILWVIVFLLPFVCLVWMRTCAVEHAIDSASNLPRSAAEESTGAGRLAEPAPGNAESTRAEMPQTAGNFSTRAVKSPTYKRQNDFNLALYESRPSYVVTGTVATESEDALPGALVTLSATRSPVTEIVEDLVNETLSDAAGRYEFRLAAPFLGWIGAQKAGYGRQALALDARSPGLIVRNFSLKEADSAIEGLVLDVQGKAVPGALVTASLSPVVNPNGTTIAPGMAKVDNAGRFQLRDLPSGRVYVSASTPAHVKKTQELQLLPGKTERIEFRLAPTTTVALLVKDRQSKPINRAKVQTSAGFELTDDRGMALVPAPPGIARFDVSLSAPGYVGKTIETAAGVVRYEVTLESASTCRGQVISETGLPVPEALVDVFPAEGVVLTDGAGLFSVPVPAPPIREIRVKRNGYLDERVLFLEETVPPFIRIRLKHAEGGIYGRVVNGSGKPVKKFILSTLDPQAGTGSVTRVIENEDGLFSIADIAPGNYQLTAATMGGAAKSSALRIEIRSGWYFGEVVVTLK